MTFALHDPIVLSTFGILCYVRLIYRIDFRRGNDFLRVDTYKDKVSSGYRTPPLLSFSLHDATGMTHSGRLRSFLDHLTLNKLITATCFLLGYYNTTGFIQVMAY